MGSALIAAAAATAFNLICTGTHAHRTLEQDLSEPFAETYRIDLAANLWCTGDCKSQSPIAAVAPGRIDFIRTDSETSSSTFSMVLTVDRETGKLDGLTSATYPNHDMIADDYRASCVRANFTGFPVPATKF